MSFHNHHHHHHHHLSQQDLTPLHHFPSDQPPPPNWLSSTTTTPNTSNFLHLHTSPDSSTTTTPTPPQPHQPPPQWPILPVDSSSSLDLKDAIPPDGNNNPTTTSGSNTKLEGGDWQGARCKAEILGHPLYEQLLSAHVACLRIATPVDQLPRIDAQLAQSQHVVAKYSPLGGGSLVGDDYKELDQFMVTILVLHSR